MNRTNIPDDHGMLFIFPTEENRVMWMKDTPHALDMLFIDSHGKIVFIAPDAEPYSTTMIRAEKPALAVLELAGRTAAKDNIHAGDVVTSPYFTP